MAYSFAHKAAHITKLNIIYIHKSTRMQIKQNSKITSKIISHIFVSVSAEVTEAYIIADSH